MLFFAILIIHKLWRNRDKNKSSSKVFNVSKAPLRSSYQVSYFPPLTQIERLPSILPIPPVPPIPSLSTLFSPTRQFNNRFNNNFHLNGIDSNPRQNVNVNQFVPNHLNNSANPCFPQLHASFSSNDLPSYPQAMNVQNKRRSSLVNNFN